MRWENRRYLTTRRTGSFHGSGSTRECWKRRGMRTVPLMERMKVLWPSSPATLDEFFMIRVGSLYDMAAADNRKLDIRSGMTASQQLGRHLCGRGAPLQRAATRLTRRSRTAEALRGVRAGSEGTGAAGEEVCEEIFKEQILPVLSPQIIDANHPFPHLISKEIYVVANLKQNNKTMMGIVPVPEYISDVLYLPGHDIRYIRMEKVIMEYLDLVFDRYEVSDKNYICVTRNADIFSG